MSAEIRKQYIYTQEDKTLVHPQTEVAAVVDFADALDSYADTFIFPNTSMLLCGVYDDVTDTWEVYAYDEQAEPDETKEITNFRFIEVNYPHQSGAKIEVVEKPDAVSAQLYSEEHPGVLVFVAK